MATTLGDGNVTASGVVRGDTVRAASLAKFEIGTTAKTSDLEQAFAAKAAQTPTFTEAASLVNLAGSGEAQETMWGKVKRAITDFISHLTSATAHSSLFAAKAAQTPTFTEAATLSNLAGSGEAQETMWGKVKKAITDFISHLTDAAAHSSLFAAKRDRTDNACHQTTSGFSPWFATLPSGYEFGDAQPVFDSTTSKWTWYVEGSGVSANAESGASTASATSATFTFEDSGTKTFTATRFAATEATENENYVTKSYVASQFSSENTSLVAAVNATIASRCASLDPATSSIADIINALKGN